jgi:hypothetical protein
VCIYASKPIFVNSAQHDRFCCCCVASVLLNVHFCLVHVHVQVGSIRICEIFVFLFSSNFIYIFLYIPDNFIPILYSIYIFDITNTRHRCIQVLFKFYSNFIQILFKCYSTFIEFAIDLELYFFVFDIEVFNGMFAQ